jgi:two-component system, OmpR family, sensor histidine kinase KdpD
MFDHLATRRILGILVGVGSISATTGAMAALTHYVAIPNISLLYLPPILMTAVYFGTAPALVAATIAVAEYDFFLLRPVFTFTISQVQDLLAFVIFVVVALLTSQLAAGARARAEAAQRRATESETLYKLGEALMSAQDLSQVLRLIAERVVEVFGVDRCAIFVPNDNDKSKLVVHAVGGATPDREAHATALWVLQHGVQAEIPVAAGDNRRLYVPLRTADHVVGVMEIGRKPPGDALDLEERRFLTSLAAQTALAIVRTHGEEERRRRIVFEESDRLKSSLLRAVSHDLRTPLASIKAAATSLLLPDSVMGPEGINDLLTTIDHEADRLNRLVGNLLDLSRIEAGVLRPVLDWYDVREVIEGFLPRLHLLLGPRPSSVDLQIGPLLINIDRLRIEALLLNLFENAAKYSPPMSPIELRVWDGKPGLSIAVADHGPGVPSHLRQRIFGTFYRGQHHSDRHPGTGLGLAICRGIAEAHGATLRVEDTPGGGATFILTLPPTSTDDEHGREEAVHGGYAYSGH